MVASVDCFCRLPSLLSPLPPPARPINYHVSLSLPCSPNRRPDFPGFMQLTCTCISTSCDCKLTTRGTELLQCICRLGLCRFWRPAPVHTARRGTEDRRHRTFAVEHVRVTLIFFHRLWLKCLCSSGNHSVFQSSFNAPCQQLLGTKDLQPSADSTKPEHHLKIMTAQREFTQGSER